MRRRHWIGVFSFALLGLVTVLLQGQRSVRSNPGKWIKTAAMREARASAGAVSLPDGRVLVTGGTSSSGPLATAEFLGISGSLTNVAAMAVPRSEHISVALKDGRVLVAGGRTTGGAATNAAELFDPATNAWTPVGAMQAARIGATATVLYDGSVLVAGGDSGAAPLATLERFNAATLQFDPVFACM